MPSLFKSAWTDFDPSCHELITCTRLTMDRDGTLAPSISKLLSLLSCSITFLWTRFPTIPYSSTLPCRCYDYEISFSVAQGPGFWSVRVTGNNVARSFLSDFCLVQFPIVASFSFNLIHVSAVVTLFSFFLFVLLCYLKISGGSFYLFSKKKQGWICYFYFYSLFSFPSLLYIFMF